MISFYDFFVIGASSIILWEIVKVLISLGEYLVSKSIEKRCKK